MVFHIACPYHRIQRITQGWGLSAYREAVTVRPAEISHPGKVRQYAITFLEGWTFSQFRKALDEHPALRHDSDKLNDSELLRAIGAKESHAEGLFFPDTYFFTRNSSDLTILKRAYQAMQQHLETVWLARQEFLPLKDQYDGLILASIIEKKPEQIMSAPRLPVYSSTVCVTI